MRYLLILFVLTCGNTHSFAQNQLYKGFQGSKWYINAAEISEFGRNDSTILVTSVSRGHYVYFGEKLEFGQDSNKYYKPESKFYLYRVAYDSTFHSGWIDLYNSKKELRKGNPSFSYDLTLDASELRLTEWNYNEIIKDPALVRTLFLSTEKESLSLTATILGNWVCDSSINLIFNPPTDTITFRRSSAQISDATCLYSFDRQEGELRCKSKCLEYEPVRDTVSMSRNVRSRGYAPDPYYITHENGLCSIDLKNRQLVFYHGEISYTIVELTENQMKLVHIPK